MSKAFPAKEDIQMFIPDDDRSDRWFETLKKFILQIEPTWFQDIESARPCLKNTVSWSK